MERTGKVYHATRNFMFKYFLAVSNLFVIITEKGMRKHLLRPFQKGFRKLCDGL